MASVLRFMDSSPGSASGGGDRTSTGSTSSSSSSGKQSSRSSSSVPLLSRITGGLRKDSNANLSNQPLQQHSDLPTPSPSATSPRVSKPPKHVKKSPGPAGDDTAILAALYQPGLPSGPIYFFPRHPKRQKSKSTVPANFSSNTDAVKYVAKPIPRRESAPSPSTTKKASQEIPDTSSTLSLAEALASLRPPSPLFEPRTSFSSRPRDSSDERERHTAISWITNRTLTHKRAGSSGSSSAGNRKRQFATPDISGIQYCGRAPVGLVPTAEAAAAIPSTAKIALRAVPLYTPLIPTTPPIATADGDFLRDVLESSTRTSQDTIPNTDIDSESEEMSRSAFPRSRGVSQQRPDSAMSGLMEMKVDTSKLPPPTKNTIRHASPRSRGAPPKPPTSLFGTAEMSAMLGTTNLETFSEGAMRFASPRSQAPRRGAANASNAHNSTLEPISSSPQSPASLGRESTMSSLTQTTTSDTTTSRSSHSSGGRRKHINKERVLEDYLGIYTPEQKLGHGRSGADEFAARLASKFSWISGANSGTRPDPQPPKHTTSPPSSANSSFQETSSSLPELVLVSPVPDIKVSSPHTQSSGTSELSRIQPLDRSPDKCYSYSLFPTRSGSLPSATSITGKALKPDRSRKSGNSGPAVIPDIPSLPNAHDYARRQLPPVPPVEPQHSSLDKRVHHQRRGSQHISVASNKHKYASSQDITNDLASWAEAMFPVPYNTDTPSFHDHLSPIPSHLSSNHHRNLSSHKSLSIVGELPTPPPTATTSICTRRSSSVCSVPLSPRSIPTGNSGGMNFPDPPSNRSSRGPFEFEPLGRDGTYVDTSGQNTENHYSGVGIVEDSDEELEAFLKKRPSAMDSIDYLPENLDFLDADDDGDAEFGFYTPESCECSSQHDVSVDGCSGRGEESFHNEVNCGGAKNGGNTLNQPGVEDESLEREIEALLRDCGGGGG